MTAVSPSGTPHTPAGLLVYYDGKLVYHLGDTCLFSDLKLISTGQFNLTNLINGK